MGANGVVDVIKGKTPRDAYDSAVLEARYECGSGGYTGSIAESSGFFIHSARPLLRWEAEQVANDLLHNDKVSKWGPTALIPVADAVSTRKITAAVDTTGMDYDEVNTVVLAAVRAKLRAGESIESVHTTTETQTKVTVTAAEGDTKTVYIVKDKYGRNGNTWQYPTLAAAKAAAKAALERDKYAESFYITKQTVKGDKEALVTVARKTTKAATTITAVIGKCKTGAPTTWVTAGWYSS
jgi:hypothetical protein